MMRINPATNRNSGTPSLNRNSNGLSNGSSTSTFTSTSSTIGVMLNSTTPNANATIHSETCNANDEIDMSNLVINDDLNHTKNEDDLDEQADNNNNDQQSTDDNLDDEYDEEDEDEDNSYLSPMVQVKYGVDYDYDNKKFKLVEGEKLFLINKANDDWWLCLRLDENLTFFVPASYVKEIVRSKSLKPPPRPPPPPPSVLHKYSKRLSESDSDSKSRPPEVKKRQFVNTSATNLDESNQIYENLSNLTNTKSDSSTKLSKLPSDANNIDSIMNELDECLDKEELSFINKQNKTNSNAISMNTSTVLTNVSPQTTPSSDTPEPDYVIVI